MLKNIKDKLLAFLPKKWPSLKQCKLFPSFLNEKEKPIFQISLTTFIVCLVVLLSIFYFQNTKVIPASGGVYTEGIVGYPQLLNPIYSSANDVDRDISFILFSGIAKHDSLGNMIPGLAEDISSQNNVFEITLRENLKWSDGERLTADDIVFTIETIQNSKTRSPLRPEWAGVKVEKVSDLTVKFYLEQESSIFLNRLFLQPIPKHIWKDVNLDGLPLSTYNLNPISSGPYRFKSIKRNHWEKIESITLEINPYYYGERPNIEEITFVFFDDIASLISASRRGDIQGFAAISPRDYDLIVKETKFKEYCFDIPRVFNLFFNLEGESELIKDQEFRQALSYAIDKEALLEAALSSRGQIINSPFLPEIYGFNFEGSHEFNNEKASEMLDNLGLSKNENGIREKLLTEERVFEFKRDLNTGSQGEEVRELQKCLTENEFYDEEITGFYGAETRDAVNRFQEEFKDEILAPGGFSQGTGMVSENTRKKLNEICGFTPEVITEISFTITTVDQPLMVKTAEEIKRQWEELGIRIDLSLLDISSLENEVIKPRNYDILLFGKAFDLIPDPFPFWHSSQKNENGFNLSMYSTDTTDDLLEKLRVEIDQEKRETLFHELHNLIVKDVPIIFLYNPEYTLFTSERIKGISSGLIFNPSQRFHNIENWYIRTKRVRK